jgi:hypothetical protein
MRTGPALCIGDSWFVCTRYPDRPSRFKAPLVARERLLEGRLCRDLCIRPVFFADAVPLGGAGNFTPAFLALESPIAIACLGLRTPCFLWT